MGIIESGTPLPPGGYSTFPRPAEPFRSDRALASVWRSAVADGAGLPAQCVHLEHLIRRTSAAILGESCGVPRLRLYLCSCFVLLARFLLGDGFCSPLEVFFTELELRHRYFLIQRGAFLGFEDYGGPFVQDSPL